MKIAQSIVYTTLSTSTGVTDLVGTRIYPARALQNATVPYIVTKLISEDPLENSDGPQPEITARVLISAYSTEYDNAHDIATAIKAALDGIARTTVAGYLVDYVRYIGTLDDVVDDNADTEGLHGVQMEFSIEYYE